MTKSFPQCLTRNARLASAATLVCREEIRQVCFAHFVLNRSTVRRKVGCVIFGENTEISGRQST